VLKRENLSMLEEVRQDVSLPARQTGYVPTAREVIRERPQARGKFLYAGSLKLWVRGVTYGTFRPDNEGNEYASLSTVAQDFGAMAKYGINAVRTYTVPPRWFLDVAAEHGLRVMIGLPWEQHVTFLDGPRSVAKILERVRGDVRKCAHHPAVLCYAMGNEIPATIVRWYGRRRVERFLKGLYDATKAEDPDGLVTYVNYPTTEYLQLPFIDIVTFNVYLETQDRLRAYLKRLQNLAGQRPLLMAEIGFDSLRNGDDKQAEVLDWQVRTAFACGCCGTFVFAWTDEWYRGGHDVYQDWQFGLTTRERHPKLALNAIGKAYAEIPFPPTRRWPRVSVVVCTFNGARTIRNTLEALQDISYPDFEVIVVNDGSTDRTAAIVSKYPVRVIHTSNRGLSCARNVGLANATGEIVAYTDDDAWPDGDWLIFMAAAFMESNHVGIGGSNFAPPGDGRIADCVANAPGGPVHVLLTDELAEHIPGCNMAFRKAQLEAIGGFDPRFRVAGDDVDVCWRLQERGWTIGFTPAAVVWHHRRNSIRAYWRQQVGYGKAEALLEQKWPEKYNAAGHLAWTGRIYGKGVAPMLGAGRGRIYQGTWGCALFQSIYEPAPGLLRSLPAIPEWYLVIAALAIFTALGVFWPTLLLGAAPLLVLAIAAPIVQAGLNAARASFITRPRSRMEALQLTVLTTILHLLQPLARLTGRIRYGLTPWRGRHRHMSMLTFPRSRKLAIWSERWRSAEAWLASVESELRREPVWTARGGSFDTWDLMTRGGLFGAARARMAIEEHGAGRQYVRFKLWPRCDPTGIALMILLAVLALAAAIDGASVVALALAAACLGLTCRTLLECAWAEGALCRAVSALEASA
jgi:GT2 family glycosyltransferase